MNEDPFMEALKAIIVHHSKCMYLNTILYCRFLDDNFIY